MGTFIHYVIFMIVSVVVLVVIFMIRDQLRLMRYSRQLDKIGDINDYRKNHPHCVKPNGDIICYKCKSSKTIRITNLRNCSQCKTILFHIANEDN